MIFGTTCPLAYSTYKNNHEQKYVARYPTSVRKIRQTIGAATMTLVKMRILGEGFYHDVRLHREDGMYPNRKLETTDTIEES